MEKHDLQPLSSLKKKSYLHGLERNVKYDFDGSDYILGTCTALVQFIYAIYLYVCCIFY